MLFYCRGLSKRLGPNAFEVTILVNGTGYRRIVTRASCHDAAYLATQAALRIGRSLGARNVVIQNTSELAREQLRGRFRVRSPRMRRHHRLCRALEQGMHVSYI